jgi:hypothetical protein
MLQDWDKPARGDNPNRKHQFSRIAECGPGLTTMHHKKTLVKRVQETAGQTPLTTLQSEKD